MCNDFKSALKTKAIGFAIIQALTEELITSTANTKVRH
jgi:hypothetical protein